MKDLFVLTADADAQAVMKSVLARHQALGIRPVSFDTDRNPLKDSGMVINGPELARLRKGKYKKILLLWDYHGSGWELKYTPEECEDQIRKCLSRVTWKNHSGAVVLVLELEEWLWCNPASLCSYYGINSSQLREWMREFAAGRSKTVLEIQKNQPKEMFEYICLEKIKRTISPRNFEKISASASLKKWEESESFRLIAQLLRERFPCGHTA